MAAAAGLRDGESISNSLKKKSNAELYSIGEKWVEKLSHPKTVEDMASAAVAGCLKRQVERQREAKIERTQVGLINIENFHNIDVDLSTGDAKTFQDYVVIPENIEIKVTQYGLINISTTDRISVSVALSALSSAASLEKATLASVLNAIGQ